MVTEATTQIVDDINQTVTGTAGSNGTQVGQSGNPGQAETASWDNYDFSPVPPPNPGSTLYITPTLVGGAGGGGAAGNSPAAARPTESGSVNGNTTTTTYMYSAGEGGGTGGAGGSGGDIFLEFGDDFLGSAATAYAEGAIVTVQGKGGAGGLGSYGGTGASAGFTSYSSVTEGGETYITQDEGAQAGRGGDGGQGGDGGTASSKFDDFTGYVTATAELTVGAQGGNGGEGGGAGAGNTGAQGGDGGTGGQGGAGASATATFTGNNVVDNSELEINVAAQSGEGGEGGDGGGGGRGLIDGVSRYANNGAGGAGGNGGNATAVMTDNTLTAPNLSVTVDAILGAGGEGGGGGTNSGDSPAGASGMTGAYGTGHITFTDNMLQAGVGLNDEISGTSVLTLSFYVIDEAPPQGGTAVYQQLDGASGGNIDFEGNTFLGTGSSELNLEVPLGGVTVDTLDNMLSIDGSSGNRLEGFSSFVLDSGDTFIAGHGSYELFPGDDPDTLVYTPQSNDVTLYDFNSSDVLLDFRGFGNTLDAQDVANATTVANGNTYINVPGAGTIEFVGYTGGIPSTDEEFTACYCQGTRILTDKGERAVEALAVGDKVVTQSGAVRPIKWIGRRSYAGRFIRGNKHVLPVCIRAGALGDDVPARNLWISPHHAMFFTDDHRDGALIEAKDLVNGVSIVQAEHVEEVAYFHIELDTHDVIIAEGAPSETFVDDENRAMFQNAHDYTLRYPDAASRPARYCAQRLQQGYELEIVRRRIALRAGLLRAADATCVGSLRGALDLVAADMIAGWAENAENPDVPVCLDIIIGGKLVGQALANCDGRHGFAFMPPAGIAFKPDAVRVCRSLDGAALPLSADAERAPPLRHTAA